MSRFKPARFGNAAVNIITGELQIEGATVVNATTVTGTDTISSDVSLVLVNIPGPLPETFTLTLPNIADVPVGHTISFKIATNTGMPGSRVFLSGDANVDGAVNVRMQIAFQAITLCSNGTIWNIIRYFDGTI